LLVPLVLAASCLLPRLTHAQSTFSTATTLGGTGAISPTGSNSVVVTGTLAPGVAGAGIGTLTFTPVNGNVTLQSGSAITFELSANHANDKTFSHAPRRLRPHRHGLATPSYAVAISLRRDEHSAPSPPSLHQNKRSLCGGLLA